MGNRKSKRNTKKFHSSRIPSSGMASRQIIDDLGNRCQMLHEGLIKTEQRFNAMWNTLNAFVRFMQIRFAQPKFEPLTQEAFEAGFMEAGRILYKEAEARNKAGFARIKEQAARGEMPTPMESTPTSVTDIVLAEAQANAASMVADVKKVIEDVTSSLLAAGQDASRRR